MSEWSCDRCGVEVPDGAGHYIEDDRVCASCAIDNPDSGK